MTRHRRARVAELRTCAYCHYPIAEQRPVFLVAMPDSRILGPLHAGCAERAVLAVESNKPHGLEAALPFGRLIPVAREETLPW